MIFFLASFLGLLNWSSFICLTEAATINGTENFASNPVFSYEVDLPLPNYGSPCASQIVVNQVFGNSYAHPALIQYSPPAECADFTHVTAELSLSTYDYQYDRLMHLAKDGVEVWRPSTPEPVGRNVTSKETKDLSTFVNLFNTEGLLEFSLDNIVTSTNDGTYDAKLQLFYYRDAPGHLDDNSWFYDPNSPPTKLQAVVANWTTIYQQPAQGSIPVLPRNVTRAVLNVFASGNSNEEFWYGNDFTGGGGPTRLVQVFLDGTLAGVADPFPIVYTGGLNPDLWQPLMGLKAADVPSYVIDITPFLPTLWNSSVSVTIAVGSGYSQPESISSNWIVSASLLTWESEGLIGEGSIQQTNSTSTGAPINAVVSASFTAEGAYYTHGVSNSASLRYSDQKNRTYGGVFSWYQSAQMVNHLNESSVDEIVTQVGQGISKSTWEPSNGSVPIEYERSHYYPLAFTTLADGDSTQVTSVNRSYEVNVTNFGAKFWETIVQESTDYDNYYTCINDVYAEGYHRHAEAVNGEVVVDTSS